MDITLNFILGSISSLGVVLLGFSIYAILKINKRLKSLEKLPDDIKKIENDSIGNFKATHNSIDSLHDMITKDINSANNTLRSYIDSRIDKLVNNVSVEISDDRKNIENLRSLLEQVATDHSERLATLETFKKIDDDKIEQINS